MEEGFAVGVLPYGCDIRKFVVKTNVYAWNGDIGLRRHAKRLSANAIVPGDDKQMSSHDRLSAVASLLVLRR